MRGRLATLQVLDPIEVVVGKGLDGETWMKRQKRRLAKALAQVAAHVRGGRPVRGYTRLGRTRSGKPIFDRFDHRAHADYTAADHDDAIVTHAEWAITTPLKSRHYDAMQAHREVRQQLQRQQARPDGGAHVVAAEVQARREGRPLAPIPREPRVGVRGYSTGEEWYSVPPDFTMAEHVGVADLEALGVVRQRKPRFGRRPNQKNLNPRVSEAQLVAAIAGAFPTPPRPGHRRVYRAAAKEHAAVGGRHAGNLKGLLWELVAHDERGTPYATHVHAYDVPEVEIGGDYQERSWGRHKLGYGWAKSLKEDHVGTKLTVKGMRTVKPHARKGKPVKGYAASIPERHRRKIAEQTMRMHCAGVAVMGGPDHVEACEILGQKLPPDCTCRGRTGGEKPGWHPGDHDEGCPGCTRRTKGLRRVKLHLRGGKPVAGYIARTTAGSGKVPPPERITLGGRQPESATVQRGPRYLQVTQSYGRDMASKKEVTLAYLKGKDFTVASVFGPDAGRQINRQDAEAAGIGQLMVRYKNNTQIAAIDVGKLKGMSPEDYLAKMNAPKAKRVKRSREDKILARFPVGSLVKDHGTGRSDYYGTVVGPGAFGETVKVKYPNEAEPMTRPTYSVRVVKKAKS